MSNKFGGKKIPLVSAHQQLEYIINLESFGKFDQALEEIKKNEKKVGREGQVIKCRMLMCTGKFDDAIALSSLMLKNIQKNKNQSLQLEIKDYEALTYIFDNKLPLAESALQEAEKLLEILSEKERQERDIGIGWFYYAKGLFLERKGHFNLALKLIEKSVPFIQKYELNYYFSVIIGTIGRIYDNKGDLELALSYYEQEKELAEEAGNEHRLGRCMQDMARIHWKKNNLQKSFDYYKRSLDLFEKGENKSYVPETLDYLIRLSLEMDAAEQAQNYLAKLKELSETSEDEDATLRYRLSQASALKLSRRVTNQSKAQEIFRQIAQEEIVHHELTLFAILNLLDLLFTELKAYGEEEVMDEIHLYLQTLQTMVQTQESSVLLVESLLLQSKLALLDLEVNKSKKLLTRAEMIARDKGLDKLVVKISNEYDNLLNQQNKWKELLERNASLEERLDLSQANNLVEQLLHKRAEEVEIQNEEPIMLLILADTGITLFSKTFLPENPLSDQLIGGLMMAINTFSQEILTSGVDRVRSGEHTFLTEQVDPFLFCYAFKGQSYLAHQKLKEFAVKIQTSTTTWKSLLNSNNTGLALDEHKKTIFEQFISDIFVKQN